jgi:hypothetical protein
MKGAFGNEGALPLFTREIAGPCTDAARSA